jgi:hypothetical protein
MVSKTVGWQDEPPHIARNSFPDGANIPKTSGTLVIQNHHIISSCFFFFEIPSE